MANVSYLKDAFRPNLNPELYRIERPTRVATVLRKHKLISGRGEDMKRNCKFMVSLGRENFLLEKDWNKRLKADDQLVIIRLPEQNLQLHGGGGGSNPLRLILQVALIVASIYAPYLAGLTQTINGVTSVTLAGSLLSAGVLIIGGIALNALMSVKPANINGGGLAQGNQINMISSQNNVANLHGPKPVAYGYRRIYPNLAAAPYVESSNNEMYLHQLMVITQGKFSVERIYIEFTPIDNFQEAQYQIIPPGGEVTLFNDNVYTAPEVQGLELKKATSGGPDIIGYRMGSTQTQVGTDAFDRPIYEYDYYYTPIYGTLNWFGGYTATPAGTKTTRLSVDLFWPSGLAYMNDEGDVQGASTDIIVQARKIDDKGNPLGDWGLLSETPDLNDFPDSSRPRWFFNRNTKPASTRITMATRDQQIRTLYFSVAEGRYQVRMARTDTGGDATRTIDMLQWAGLRSYLPSVRRYADVTMLAVKIRGTNNVNNQIQRRINVTGTRILPVWNGSGWTEQPTRSIAWAAVDILKNPVYGRKLTDRRINLIEAFRLDAVWSARGDYCDGVFESETTTWDALTSVLMGGRAKPVYYMGIIDFFRNEPKQLPSAVFTPSNMIEGSFAVEYLFHKQDAHDYVIVEYTDPDTWTVKEVECILPGSTTRKALKVQMPFITNRNHAWREGIFLAASLLVQRSFPKFTTDRDGMIPRFGDKLLINHDVPNWGGSGHVETIGNNVIVTSEPLDWKDGQNHIIKLRGKKGQLLGSYPITKLTDYSGRATGLPDMSEIFSHEPTYYVFGTTERCGLEVTMLTATPDSSEQVAIATVNYSDYPHTVENNLVPPPAPPQTGEVATDLTINQMSVSPSLVENVFRIEVNTAAGASNYDFAYSADGGTAWVDLGSSSSPSITTDDLAFGNIKLRARATTSLFAGSWFVQDEFIEEIVHVGSDIPPLLATEVVPAVNGLPVYVNITLTGVDIPDVEIYMVEENDVIIYTGYVTSGQSFTFQRQYVSGAGVINYVAYGVDKYDQNSATATQQVTV